MSSPSEKEAKLVWEKIFKSVKTVRLKTLTKEQIEKLSEFLQTHRQEYLFSLDPKEKVLYVFVDKDNKGNLAKFFDLSFLVTSPYFYQWLKANEKTKRSAE